MGPLDVVFAAFAAAAAARRVVVPAPAPAPACELPGCGEDSPFALSAARGDDKEAIVFAPLALGLLVLGDDPAAGGMLPDELGKWNEGYIASVGVSELFPFGNAERGGGCDG